MINHGQMPITSPGNPAPELAPSTQRDAEHLANRYGFANLAALAESLPEGAEVLDVGAGASPLGREVARLRPDIHWTNLDTSYDDPHMRDELLPGAPHNVSFVTGDAQQLGGLFPAGTFDRVFSFWLLPHLSLNDDTAAVAAAEHMFEAVKDGGELFIGPVFNSPYHDGTPETAYGDARRTIKAQDMNPTDFAREAVRQTRLPIVARHLHRSINRAIYDQFGTSRYARGEGTQAQILDPRTGTYVSRYSTRGIALTGQFLVNIAARFLKPGA